MRRREFLMGAAAVATIAGARDAEAISVAQELLLLGSARSLLRQAAAAAANSNLVINPVNSVSTITAPTSAPSTTGYTNVIPASVGYIENFTGNTTQGSNVISSVSSVTGLIVGQFLVENESSANPYPRNVPLGATITGINSGASQITISEGAVGTATALTLHATGGIFDIMGGVPGVYGGNFVATGPTTGNSQTPPTAQDAGTTPYAIEFTTTAANVTTAAPGIMFKVFQNGAAPYDFRVAIDGVYQTANPIAFDATGRFGTIQFANAGVHDVRIELPSGLSFQQLWVINGATISAPTPQFNIRAAGYSDSYFLNGLSGSWPMRGICQQFGLRMGWRSDHLAVSGTGYTIDGGSNYTFANSLRTRDVLVRNYNVIYFWGSVNDAAATASQMQAAALTTWQAVRANNPTAFIIVFGVPTTVNLNAATATTLEQGLAAAFAQWGDPNSRWIPVTTDPQGAWINAGNVGTYIGADGTHLTDPVGTTAIALLMQQRVTPLLP